MDIKTRNEYYEMVIDELDDIWTKLEYLKERVWLYEKRFDPKASETSQKLYDMQCSCHEIISDYSDDLEFEED